jgi:hypothetical protein
MEQTSSSETSVCNKPTRRHISEDGILCSHRRENLISYAMNIGTPLLLAHVDCLSTVPAYNRKIVTPWHYEYLMLRVACCRTEPQFKFVLAVETVVTCNVMTEFTMNENTNLKL